MDLSILKMQALPSSETSVTIYLGINIPEGLSLQLDLDFESLLGEKMYVFTVCVFVVL
jgi:hypothetical protein